MMEKGRVMAQGTYKKLMGNNKSFQKMGRTSK